MKQSFEKRGLINIGTVSFLMILLTLFLVTFALLSLSTAKSDLAFSRKLAERTTRYYEAQNAIEMLSESED